MNVLKRNLLILLVIGTAAFSMSFSSSSVTADYETENIAAIKWVKGRWMPADGGGGSIGIKCDPTQVKKNCFYPTW